jgi:hypothetical protein
MKTIIYRSSESILFSELLFLQILEEINANGIKIYPLPDCDSDEDEDYKEQVFIKIVVK